jgi:peptidoglycan-associated lipoprotein
MKKVFWVLLLGLLVLGCSQKRVATDMGTEEGTPPESQEKTVAGEMQGQETIPDEGVSSEEVAPETTPAAQAAVTFEDIHFAFDSYAIRPDARPMLDNLSHWLSGNGDARVLIEGHCDERGTNEYNLALGDRRAASVKEYLVASGVSAKKIETISYGEEKPLCEEAAESCWSRNRRAHFVVGATR